MLLLATGKVTSAPVLHFLQYRKHLIQILGHLLLTHRGEPGFNVFPHREGREDHPPLRYKAETGAHTLKALEASQISTVQADFATFGWGHTNKGFHQRGLAHAIAANHSHNFVLFHIQVQVLDDGALAIGHQMMFDA